MEVKCSFLGEYVKEQLKKEIFSMALLKVFILCHGVDHAMLSILVQLDSSLKKYAGLVHTWDHGIYMIYIYILYIIYTYIYMYIYIHIYIHIYIQIFLSGGLT